MPIKRRDFLTSTGGALAAAASLRSDASSAAAMQGDSAYDVTRQRSKMSPGIPHRPFNGSYEGEHLNQIAFPMGGIGAGMICLEGTGALTHVSLHHRPALTHEPLIFAALTLKGKNKLARVLEGPVPSWKLFPGGAYAIGISPHGGLPRFRSASFQARFPFAQLSLADDSVPVTVQMTGWSPFEPNDEDNSSLPVAGLEYTFTNNGREPLEAVFSFNAKNFMYRPDYSAESGLPAQAIRPTAGGFLLYGASSAIPTEEGTFAAWVDDPQVKVDHAWHRGSFNPLARVWSDIEAGLCVERPPVNEGAAAPGASLSVPFTLAPKGRKTIVLHLAWYVGRSNLRTAGGELFGFQNLADGPETYKPWYAGRFADIAQLVAYWQSQYAVLKLNSERFSNCFYSSTLPPEVVESVAANLSILKSPTLLRQTDGRIWGWEGCADTEGSGGPGSCTHVWNYAQSIAHLFPRLERSLRETEFGPNQNDEGYQVFRTALPIRPPSIKNQFSTAADGQLGGILKVYREWRISGDTRWLAQLWPKVRASLDYCIRSWDPRRAGWLEEPQHNTYDTWFWGPNSLCTSLYLGALQAAVQMGTAVRDDVAGYADLHQRGMQKIGALFDGEYFAQRIEWRGLKARFPEFNLAALSSLPNQQMAAFLSEILTAPESMKISEREGPPSQYGSGCLADGVMGAWMAWVCGIGNLLDSVKVASHLQAVYRHNFKRELSAQANPFRSSFACGGEGGLLLCTWPKGDAPSLPMEYSGEVWSGIEYQVASHMMAHGMVKEGLEIVRTARARYDGRVRNPFDEIEAGHWYARAMSSYALLQAYSGVRYDAVDKILYMKPAVAGDFRSFLATATGYGMVGVRGGKPFVDVARGEILCSRIEYSPA